MDKNKQASSIRQRLRKSVFGTNRLILLFLLAKKAQKKKLGKKKSAERGVSPAPTGEEACAASTARAFEKARPKLFPNDEICFSTVKNPRHDVAGVLRLVLWIVLFHRGRNRSVGSARYLLRPLRCPRLRGRGGLNGTAHCVGGDCRSLRSLRGGGLRSCHRLCRLRSLCRLCGLRRLGGGVV